MVKNVGFQKSVYERSTRATLERLVVVLMVVVAARKEGPMTLQSV